FKVSNPLFEAGLVEARDMWMVGGGSAVYRWVNGTFGPMTSPMTSGFLAVAGTSASDVWLGGFDSPEVTHFNGTGYEQLTTDAGGNAIDGILAFAPDEAYLADGTALFRFDGGSWEYVFDVGGNEYIEALWGTPGVPLALPVNGLLYEYPSSAPPVQLPGFAADEVTGMKVLPTGEAWAVGTRSKVARRFVDGGWVGLPVTIPPFTNTDLWSVHADSISEAWIVGEEGAILHWREDAGWTQHRALPVFDAGFTTNNDIYWFDIEASGKDLWLVGGKGNMGSGNYDAGVVTHLRLP
ncbi:MAG: hypothetical protein JNK82_07300, partial [Myxococcaceae bacterium]|nr:hypothetical protein [Myxococcaceae bacterium]